MPEETSAATHTAPAPAEAEIRAVPVEPSVVSRAAEAQTAPEVPVPAAAPEPTSAPVRAEVVAESAPAPVRAVAIAEPAPFVDVERALEQSGLVLVKTDPSKVKPIEAVAPSQPVAAAPRPRRAPPPDTGPLQIVETKK
jgi:hypothetical protein